jgi:hypothetical protein
MPDKDEVAVDVAVNKELNHEIGSVALPPLCRFIDVAG